MIPEGAPQAAEGGEQSIFLLSYETHEPQQRPRCHDVPKGATVPLTSWHLPSAVREIMSDTINLANYPGLLRPEIL